MSKISVIKNYNIIDVPTAFDIGMKQLIRKVYGRFFKRIHQRLYC